VFERNRRTIFNTLYTLVATWILMRFIGWIVFLQLLKIPILAGLVFWIWPAMPWLLLVAAFGLCFTQRKKISETTLVALVCMVPLLWGVVIPFFQDQIRLHWNLPQTEQVDKFYSRNYFYSSFELDQTKPIAVYHTDKKELELQIRVMSSSFQNDRWLDSTPEQHANRLMNILYSYYIEAPLYMGVLTLVPENLKVNAYWDETLLFTTTLARDGNKYVLPEGIPSLSMMGDGENWYLANWGSKKIEIHLPLSTPKVYVETTLQQAYDLYYPAINEIYKPF